MVDCQLSIIVLVRNNQAVIKDCLASAAWADELILVDTGSQDNTLKFAKEIWPKIKVVKVSSKEIDFSRWRNQGMRSAKGDWVFYLDADERISKELRQEIEAKIKDWPSGFGAFRLPRQNFYFGRRVSFGGSWPDFVTRLFWKDKFKGWQGIIHESPQFDGRLGTLKEPLVHLAHRSLSSGLKKSLEWTPLEARLFYQAGHPPVTWWRLLKVAGFEFVRRAFVLQGIRDGTVGLIEAIVQAFNRFMVYVQLWEMQQSAEGKRGYDKLKEELEQ